jgi:hypothetical protein
MTFRVEHALVMDTDDIPGRGGYAVVGLSEGVTPAERVFVAANFGISDYLHDPRNGRVFYSFCRVPGGRYAFVRRFASGTRRNATQNRLFIHTLFLDEQLFEALHGLPWRLMESKFRAAPGEPSQPLPSDGDRLLTPGFPPLEWEPPNDDELVARLRARVKRVEKLLPGVDPNQAIANVIGALQRGERALLPQGDAYELLTLLAWSTLPPADRRHRAWTQHDSMNVAASFDLANVPAGATVDVARPAPPVVQRLVEMNLASDEVRRELHAAAGRHGVAVAGDDLRAWFAWRDGVIAVREKLGEPENELLAALEALAATVRPRGRDPWVDGEEVLQLLWPNVEQAMAAGQPASIAVKRWASLLDRSGLGAKIFRDAPSADWLDRMAKGIGPQLLVYFFVFSTEHDPEAAGTREAVARWLLARRGQATPDPEILARLTVRLAVDRSALTEPLLGWLLDGEDALAVLAGATPLNSAYGDLVLLATLVAIHRAHPQTATYVRSALVPHLEASAETRQHVSVALAEAVAPILRDDPAMLVRFVQLQPPALQALLLTTVRLWITEERPRTLPVVRAIVERMAMATWPRSREADALVFALAAAGDPATRWGEVLVRIASGADPRSFADSLARLEGSDIDRAGLFDAVLRSLEPGSGPSMRALLSFTRAAWDARIVDAMRKVISGTQVVAVWESLVADAVRAAPRNRGVGRLLLEFWTRVQPAQVRNLGDGIFELTRRTGGAWRTELSGIWTPRLSRLPKDPQCQKLIDIINDSPELRMALFWRALDHRNASVELFNQFEDDLWSSDPDGYEEQLGRAVDRFAAMVPAGAATALDRARRLIELAADRKASFAVRWAAEERLSIALSRLGERDWNALVKLPPAMLVRNGSAWMTFTRQLGKSGAREAARDLETLCLREHHDDGRDGIRAGRRDAMGFVQTMWERARSAVQQRVRTRGDRVQM